MIFGIAIVAAILSGIGFGGDNPRAGFFFGALAVILCFVEPSKEEEIEE